MRFIHEQNREKMRRQAALKNDYIPFEEGARMSYKQRFQMHFERLMKEDAIAEQKAAAKRKASMESIHGSGLEIDQKDERIKQERFAALGMKK